MYLIISWAWLKMILLPHAQTKENNSFVLFFPREAMPKCCKTSEVAQRISDRWTGLMILFSSAFLSLIVLCERCECKCALNPPTFPSLVSVLRCVSIFFVEFQQHFEQDYFTTAWIHSMVDCMTMLFGKNRSQHLGPDHRSRENTCAGITKFVGVYMSGWLNKIVDFFLFFMKLFLHVLIILTLERPGWNMAHLHESNYIERKRPPPVTKTDITKPNDSFVWSHKKTTYVKFEKKMITLISFWDV